MSKTIVQRIAERFNNLTPEEREKLDKKKHFNYLNNNLKLK